jgi:multiple antibiotic resistance protein
MIFVQQADTPQRIGGLVIAIVAVHLLIGLVLMLSTKILKVIKESGVTLLARIAGLLLAAIAVQMLADAIKVLANS